ncbi:hypothetical protein [Chondromyces crocatus]|uniref:Lipoprotein n=1 Tax=Chondromyces crocatus TaxID=52 RepID=A0A0K1EMS2_CHOCO|nr:hypothetical protein [Chondromyces crocatus]AKT41933.1 uncharacterized protein CMC5_061550 [Chondromyces crocatus]
MYRNPPITLTLVLAGLSITSCTADVLDEADLSSADEAFEEVGEAVQGLAGDHLWSRRLGSAGDQRALDIVTDASGSVTLVGQLSGSLVVNGVTYTSAGGADAFVVKIDKGGVPLWARRFGTSGDQVATLVVGDAAGNTVVHVTGAGPIDFGGGPISTTGAALVKLDTNGNHVWSRNLGATANDLALDATGHVLATGQFEGTINLGLSPLTSGSGPDVFVAKINAAGTTVLHRVIGGIGPQNASAIVAGVHGEIIVGGDFTHEVVAGLSEVTGPNLRNTFIATIREDGFWGFARTLPSGGGDGASIGALAVDSAGNIIATGWDGGYGAPGSKLSLIKLTSGGTPLWSRFFSAVPFEPGDPWGSWRGRNVAVDPSDNIVLTTDPGNLGILATLDLGGGPLASGLIVARFDPSGNHTYSHRWALDGNAALAIRSNGSVFVGGSFRGTLNCGGWTLTSAGGDDLFLANLAP